MQLLIIRHGDPDYSVDSLTPKGRREAELLGERLQKMGVDDFYVSPLGRARDTAQPALDRMHKTAVTLDWLQEFPIRHTDAATGRLHVMWDFLPRERAKHPLWNEQNRWMDDSPYSEHPVRPMVEHIFSRLDALLLSYGYERAGDFYRVQTPSEQKVALVCHLGIGTILLSHLLNIAAPQLLHTAFLPPTSVTNAVTEEREKGLAQFRCIGIGDTSHLYAGNEPISRSGFFILNQV